MATEAGGALEYLGLPPSMEVSLSALDEPVRRWFCRAFDRPTAAQRLAWPAITSGKNLLLCAPTGTGKTLAAFLPILNRLLAQPIDRPDGCLYIAPLKALIQDTTTSLRHHLAQIDDATDIPVNIHVGVRTGDTSGRVRRSLVQKPPHILLTTPESLAVLLSQPSACDSLMHVRWVIVDEIHALASCKRGADLSLSLERLATVTRCEPQRIALSATCTPVELVARYLVGPCRQCSIAEVPDCAPLCLAIEPLPDETASTRNSFMARLLERLQPELSANRTTLIFTNQRSLAERLAWALRRRIPCWAEEIGVHHSALAAEPRRRVEASLKQGLLRAVVSSCTLEVGIDVGMVDAVVLVHPPGGVVRLLQRVGRAGHRPGGPRRGLVLTATSSELLEAAVIGAASRTGQAEPLRISRHPLDVLCQHLLGMAAQRSWSASEAFALVCKAYPYCDLAWDDFQACLDYLSGRGCSNASWLPSRLRWEGISFAIADKRTARLVQRNLGTILTEESRRVVLNSGGALGEVDDAFGDRLHPGDRFVLDGRCVEYRRREADAMVVEEVPGRPVVPRWAGAGWPLSEELAQRLYLLRAQAGDALREGPAELARLLAQDYELGAEAVQVLVAHFQCQECVSEIPDQATCLIEVIHGPCGSEYYVHTPLNRAGNDALARILVQRLARRQHRAATSLVADLGLALFLDANRDLAADEWAQLLSVDGFDEDLGAALASSVTLRDRFRQVALTGLMLLRQPLGRPRRVGGQGWAERRLFDVVLAAERDFVLLRQARREVLDECCHAGAARHFLQELPSKTIHWRCLSEVSPFAASWTQSEAGPGESVDPPAVALQRLHAVLTGGGAGHAHPH